MGSSKEDSDKLIQDAKAKNTNFAQQSVETAILKVHSHGQVTVVGSLVPSTVSAAPAAKSPAGKSPAKLTPAKPPIAARSPLDQARQRQSPIAQTQMAQSPAQSPVARSPVTRSPAAQSPQQMHREKDVFQSAAQSLQTVNPCKRQRTDLLSRQKR